MPHKLRKIRKFRGTRTIGYGRIGQHRDSGSKGNRKVGRHKHLWSKVVTSEPDYFGKHGFHSPQAIKKVEKTINLQRLDQLATGAEVNLTELGFTKLLGTGKITKRLTIQVAEASKTAIEKVAAAGGKIVTPKVEATEE
jgi:large subunit ribosomal protein L15